ncbi:MAG: DNA-deoxyinosine glycosylase [Clostridia bacterium]|nr:DNA-deoxyinosine glycosylase [Clostridia bacterium]
MKVIHPINPIIAPNSKILILGSMPSPESRKVGFYYGHPRNRFWSVMSTILAEPLPKTNEEKSDMLLRNKIALWDVLAVCEIEGAADSSIKNAVPNDIEALILNTDIKAVFMTGSTAYRLYEKHFAKKIPLPYHCLPSTSPANAKMTAEALAEKYLVILEYFK